MASKAKPPAYPELIIENHNSSAWNALHLDAALAHINAMAEANCRAKRYDVAKGWTFGEAASALIPVQRRAYETARSMGQLLFAFHGTKALGRQVKGGAA